MQEEIMETWRGKEMAGKWHTIRERREAQRKGGSAELQMFTVSMGMSTRRETWPRAGSWHAIRPGRGVGEL